MVLAILLILQEKGNGMDLFTYYLPTSEIVFFCEEHDVEDCSVCD